MGYGAMEPRERASLSTNAEKEHTVIVSSRIHARDIPTGVDALDVEAGWGVRAC
jgi:hypothetical protein